MARKLVYYVACTVDRAMSLAGHKSYANGFVLARYDMSTRDADTHATNVS